MTQMNIKEKLKEIQCNLVAPKGQHNKFGNYNYRSLEDINNAVKKYLDKLQCTFILADEMVEVGGKNYVKAIATLADCESDTSISVTAFAREPESQAGMSPSQQTGSASSYARKYAASGLLNIDDTKDADATNTHGKKPLTKTKTKDII